MKLKKKYLFGQHIKKMKTYYLKNTQSENWVQWWFKNITANDYKYIT
jgi:hypothetical protein